MLFERRRFVAWLLCAPAMAGIGRGAAAEEERTPILRIETGGHSAQVRQVLFTPDGQRLISVGKDKVARVWNLQSGRQEETLRYQIGPGREGQLFAAAFRPAGLAPLLAIGEGGAASDILVLDGATHRLLRRLPGHRYVVTGLAFSPDGARLASCGGDGTLRVWDPDSGRRLWEKTLTGRDGARSYLYGLAFSPDGRFVAVGADDGAVRVWETGGGKAARSPSPGSAPVLCLAWSPRGDFLAFGGRDGVIHLWNPATGAQETLRRQPDSVNSLVFSPDGQRLLSAGGENGVDFQVRTWHVASRTPLHAFREHETTVFSAAFSPDGTRVASADALGNIYVWNPSRANDRGRGLAGTGGSIFSVAWSRDNRRIAWGTAFEGPLRGAFDLYQAVLAPDPNPAAGAEWQGAQTERAGVRLSREADGATVFLRDATGREIARIPAQPGDQVKSFTFTPDGRVVVGSDLYLALWSVAGGKAVRERLFEGHQGSVLGVSVSPNGLYLASGSADQTVRVWKLREAAAGAALPLLSLFPGRNREWVAWNEKFGYYAASAAGDDLIGWHVNRGPGEAAEFHKAFQFRERFYRPDVVCRLVETGGVESALRRAAEVRPAPATPATVGQAVARLPRVEILGVEPAERRGDVYVTRADAVNVRVRVTQVNAADLPGIQLDLRVNRPVTSRRLREVPAAPEAPDERLLPATLLPGANTLSVVARTDAAGETPPVSVAVAYEPATRQAAAPRNLYLLAVGVSRYLAPDIPPLQFAANDAREIATLYQDQRGKLFDAVEVERLTDEKATREGFLQALERMKERTASGAFGDNAGDLTILFVSGHGFSENGSFYFAPADAVPDKLAQTGVPWSKIVGELQGLSCANVLLVLDHCYSGGASIEQFRQMARQDERSRGTDPATAALRATRQGNFLTFTASNSHQESYEHPSWNHGAFTLAFLKALRGESERVVRPDGTVMLHLTEDYVHDEVAALLQRSFPEGVEQSPALFCPPDMNKRIPIARVRPAAGTSAPAPQTPAGRVGSRK